MESEPRNSRKLQVSLEGLELSDEHVARIETAMRSAVLTELARIDVPHGFGFEPIGSGTIVDGHITHGIILRDLGSILAQRPR